MNRKDIIFESLNIQPNEEFKLNTHSSNFTFKLNNDLQLLYKFKNEEYRISDTIFRGILIGENEIVKIDKHNNTINHIIDLELVINNMIADENLIHKEILIPMLQDVVLRMKHYINSNEETTHNDE